jgi:hypothetical protein
MRTCPSLPVVWRLNGSIGKDSLVEAAPGANRASMILAIVAGAAATLIAVWVVAKALHVRLAKGWE